MVLHDGPVIHPPHRVAPPGTPAADQLRDKFIADILAICGDIRLFVFPKLSDTTTLSEASRHARTVTADATVAARLSALGSGVQVDFDGDDDEADTPDQANLSFGDSVVDQPFSILWVGTPDTDTSVQSLISKINSGTVDEWELLLSATNSYPTFNLIDASASGIIGRSHDTVIGTSTTFLAATYDGSRAVTGMNIYKDGALVDDGTGDTTGTYTAMEDTASLVRIGNRFVTDERFYNGKMAMVAVVAKDLSIEEVWAIKALINAFFDLAL